MPVSKSLQLAIALISLLLLMCFYLWMGTINLYSGNNSDSHYYLFLADFFVRGASEFPSIESYIAKTSIFPPGFPFVLGFFGGGVDNMVRAHQINNALFAAGFVAFFYWLHTHGLKPVAALTLTLALALNHQQLVYLVDILSESQYFLFSVLIIIVLENAKSRERLLIASALIGFGALSRTIGIAFLLPLLVQLIRFPTNWPSKGFLFSLALLPTLGWKIIHGLYLESSVPQYSYLAKLVTFYADASLDAAFDVVTFNLTALIQSWTDYLSGLPSTLHIAIAFVFGLSILICWIVRLRRLDTLALYLFAYFGIVIIFPFPWQMDRFMLPIFPFLLGILVLDSGKLFVERKNIAQSFLLGFLIITFLPSAFAVSQRMLLVPDEKYMKYRMTSQWLTIDSVENANKALELMHIREVAEKTISQYIDTDDCVYAPQPSSIMIATRQLSLLLWNDGHDANLFNPAELVFCDYVFMLRNDHLEAAVRLFPYEIMQEQMKPIFTIDAQIAGQKVVVAMMAKIIREDDSNKTGQVNH